MHRYCRVDPPTSRGQDENSFGGTRVNRWTKQKSGARISFEVRKLVSPAGWIFRKCPSGLRPPALAPLPAIGAGAEHKIIKCYQDWVL